MSGTSILDRFRPIGAPGSAGPTGVPTRGLLGPEQELAPVFAALSADVAHVDGTIADATAAATATRAAAVDRGADIVAEAQRSGPADQAAAAERVAVEAAAAAARLRAAAIVSAGAVRRKGARRLPALLRHTRTTLLDEIG